jgi:hypothetical protein
MFDEDESDSLEIDELVALFIQNYVCPTMDEEDLKKQPQDVRDFVQ